jgi:ATP-binding cassette subfamily B protein/subfamily B ATP-binding cassette protein MsbA
MKVLGRGMNRRSLAAHQADSQVTSSIQQTMAALPVIQSFTREEAEHERFAVRVDEAYRKRVAQHGWEVLYWLAIAVGFGLAAAGLTWLGAEQVLAGRLTVGEMLVFLGYLSQLYEPLNQLSHVGATVSNAGAGTQRILELLDSPREVADAPNARAVSDGRTHPTGVVEVIRDPPRAVRSASAAPVSAPPLVVQGNVSFEKVWFGYEKDRPVLQDLSFSIQAGESVAIIGPSGAGKTTLLQLLPRFYDPTAGAVCLEGADLRTLRLKDLRGKIALVPQEPTLLLATIAENIAYGKPGASLAEIQAAAEEAHADEFIRKLPQQYDTLVGEGAARLSVGEKQRISLARAFLKDAPILILDEPTSALDVDSEALVVRSLTRLMEHRTALLVAHRLSTIKAVHRILVLKDGRLIESGAPEDLLRDRGYYARVADGQLRLD